MKKILMCPLLGRPLLYFGVILMLIHFVFQLHSNWLLIVAFVLELIGVTVKYYQIKHHYDKQR